MDEPVDEPVGEPARDAASVTAVVLAAGGSRRLGRPKQLLPFRGATLLDATLGQVRRAVPDQLVVTLGGAADGVRDQVDLAGVDVALCPDFGEGCAASMRVAVQEVAAEAAGIVVVLGDQPDVSPEVIEALLAAVGDAPVGVCSYDDGLGHPLWFARERFEALTQLHGDKAVWKLVDAAEASGDLVVVPVAGAVPRDVDTWEDYEALLREDAR